MSKAPDHKNTESDLLQSVPPAFSIYQTETEKNQKLRCEICKVDSTSLDNLNEHFRGKKHRKELKKISEIKSKKKKKKEAYVSIDESLNLVQEEEMSEKLKTMNQSSKSLSLKRIHNRSKSSTTHSFKKSSDYYIQNNYTHYSRQNLRGNRYHSNYRNDRDYYHYHKYNDNYANYYDYWNYYDQNYEHRQENAPYPDTGNHMNQESGNFYSGHDQSVFNNPYSKYSQSNLEQIPGTQSNETSQSNEKNNEDKISLLMNAPAYPDISCSVNETAEEIPVPSPTARSMISSKIVACKVVKKRQDTNCDISDSFTKKLNSSPSYFKKLGKKKDTLNKVSPENPTENECFSDLDKPQDKRVASENMSEKISHLLNPLNRRDKAEVDRLLTRYSKSKKTESLLKLKLQTENGSCDKDTSKNTDHLFKNIEQLQEKINSVESQSQENYDNISECSLSNEKQVSNSASVIKKRKKSSLSVSSHNSKDMNKDSPVSENAPENILATTKRKFQCSTDSIACLKQRRLSSKESDTEACEDLFSKRRNSLTVSSKSKKHKCSSLQCLESCLHKTGKELGKTDNSKEEDENALIYDGNYDLVAQLYSGGKSNQISMETDSRIDMISQESMNINILPNANILNVEDLMTLFASKNVTIKKEFDDPLIDAIKNVDVNFLFNAADQQPTSSKDISTPVLDNLPLPPISVQEQNINVPVNKPTLSQPEACSAIQAQNCDEVTNKSTENGQNNLKPRSTSETFQLTFPELSPYKVYVNISNELQKLQKEEEEKRAVLKEIDKLIDQHQKILNELTAKKIKLQAEEDNLISRRSNLTCALSQCITNDSFINNSSLKEDTKTSLVSSKSEINKSTVLNNALLEVVSQVPSTTMIRTGSPSNNLDSPMGSNTEKNCNDRMQEEIDLPENENHAVTSTDSSSEESKDKENYSADDDIEIIPVVPKIVNIPLIDLEDLESPAKKSENSDLKEQSKSVIGKTFYEKKNFIAHETVVNSLKVVSGYMYTCSNDYTAKRFDLKDPEKIVIYKHSKRNVLQLCVEQFRNSNLVFTLCSSEKLISSFNTEDGKLVKIYHFDCIVRCISNGWNKIYAGLNSGTVMICNWKETKDLVKNLEPIKNMACTLQGGLHVLIVLAVSGQVAVRDVERNGLLIRYIKAHSDTPLFMNVYNDYVYLSSSVLLTSSNLSTGIVERTIKLTSPITGLAAYENNIFTTSFSGIVRCYPDGQMQDMRMAYGAGKSSLTCVYVYQGWVFTGNRNGEVAVFQYDSSTRFFCQFKNCRCTFTQLEDLERHVLSEVDHVIPSKNTTCPWHGCDTRFTKSWMAQDRKDHVRTHVLSSLHCVMP